MTDVFDKCGVTPLELIKIEFGDLDPYNPLLDDKVYETLICVHKEDKYSLNIAVGMAILGSLSTNSFRQRIGQEDAYLGERFKNYLAFLNKKIANPLFSGQIPSIYFGGTNREEMAKIAENPNIVDSTFYLGEQNRKPNWYHYRQYYPDTVVEPYEVHRGEPN